MAIIGSSAPDYPIPESLRSIGDLVNDLCTFFSKLGPLDVEGWLSKEADRAKRKEPVEEETVSSDEPSQEPARKSLRTCIGSLPTVPELKPGSRAQQACYQFLAGKFKSLNQAAENWAVSRQLCHIYMKRLKKSGEAKCRDSQILEKQIVLGDIQWLNISILNDMYKHSRKLSSSMSPLSKCIA
jgi:hypothetical protein